MSGQFFSHVVLGTFVDACFPPLTCCHSHHVVPPCSSLCLRLVCLRSINSCLDDAELTLLGVPWPAYSSAASSVGLDIVRVPMPDGLTPISFSQFDAAIQLVVTRYTLRGSNVLVHCRGGVGRAGLTACAWALKMGLVSPHPSLAVMEASGSSKDARDGKDGKDLENQIIMSMVERVIAMIRSRRGLKAIESYEQVVFLKSYVGWLRANRAMGVGMGVM